MTPFSRTVYLWRVYRGLTQDQLASKAGISRPNLSGIERGTREISLRTLRNLAAALNIRPGILVDGITPLVAEGSFTLNRQTMERIAEAATSGAALVGRQGQLAQLLGVVMQNRIHSARSSKRAGKRQLKTSWLALRSFCSDQELRSLIQRVSDRELLRS